MPTDAGDWSDVAAYLRAQRQLARFSLRHLARLTNVSDSYLSQVERGLHQPSPDVLKAMAGALGIPATTLYERMGWLDASDPTASTPSEGPVTLERDDEGDEHAVERAVQADPRLTDSQKKALLAMYRTLVGDE